MANPKDTIANPTQRYSYLLDERPVRIVAATYEDLPDGGSRIHTEPKKELSEQEKGSPKCR